MTNVPLNSENQSCVPEFDFKEYAHWLHDQPEPNYLAACSYLLGYLLAMIDFSHVIKSEDIKALVNKVIDDYNLDSMRKYEQFKKELEVRNANAEDF